MSDRDALHIERNTIFVLAGLLLAAIVSIAFYNLDRHPAFPTPSNAFLEQLDETQSSVVFADDPLSLTALERRHTELNAHIRPLASWPPQAPLVSFGSVPPHLKEADMELVAEDSVWSLWVPSEFAATPVFDAAVVEVMDADGQPRTCARDARGAHQCGDRGWTRVRRRDLTVDGERQSCIWAHPMEDRVVRIRFSGVTTAGTDGERLWLQTALRDSAVGTGEPVDFDLRVDNATLFHRHQDRTGWQSTVLPVVDEPGELTIDISAERPGRRHICFRFQLR